MERTLPDAVASYRGAYRSEKIPPGYRGYGHLAGTVGLSAAGIAACAIGLEGVQPLEWLAVPLTALYANLVEYAGHRGPMHHRLRGLGAIFERHARQHHRFFTHEAMQLDSSADLRAVLFPLLLVVFYLGLFAMPLALLLGWLASRNVALLFFGTGLAYYLNYELLHLAYHAPAQGGLARLPGIRALRRRHLCHHDPALMQKCNFNITYPVGDLLFGTQFREPVGEKKPASRRVAV